MTSDDQFSGFRRRRGQNINYGRDHSTWNPTGSGFLHKWPEPAQNVSEAGAKIRKLTFIRTLIEHVYRENHAYSLINWICL